MTSATLTGRAGRRPRRWRPNPAYLYVLPSLLLIGVFIAEPIVRSGWMSLHDWTVGEDTHNGIETPERVAPRAGRDSTIDDHGLTAALPPVSWTMLRLAPAE